MTLVSVKSTLSLLFWHKILIPILNFIVMKVFVCLNIQTHIKTVLTCLVKNIWKSHICRCAELGYLSELKILKCKWIKTECLSSFFCYMAHEESQFQKALSLHQSSYCLFIFDKYDLDRFIVLFPFIHSARCFTDFGCDSLRKLLRVDSVISVKK